MEKEKETRPILYVHYMNDDYRERKALGEGSPPPCFEKYLVAAAGRIFESWGGFDPLDVLSVSEDSILLRLAEKTATLHSGETVTMHYELPGLIADGSGFERFTATLRWLTREEAEGIDAEPMKDSNR